MAINKGEEKSVIIKFSIPPQFASFDFTSKSAKITNFLRVELTIANFQLNPLFNFPIFLMKFLPDFFFFDENTLSNLNSKFSFLSSENPLQLREHQGDRDTTPFSNQQRQQIKKIEKQFFNQFFQDVDQENLDETEDNGKVVDIHTKVKIYFLNKIKK